MRTFTKATALGSAVLALVAIGLGPGSPTSARADRDTLNPAPGNETMMINVPWQGGHLHYLDNGRKGLGPGDLFLGTDLPVFDEVTGERIGTSDGVELILSARHDGTVTDQTTFRFAGGHVDVDGIIRHTDTPLRMTVTGGTGRYLGVSGQLTLVKEDAHRKVEVMRLELVR
ncbi:MAG: hypothetical protein JWN91_2654 [Nocardioides sp.]|jgi:hypothetical protein|nr:hypothetical protein [Nocardioides sp.]